MSNPCITPHLCYETLHCCGGCNPADWTNLQETHVNNQQVQMLYDKQTQTKSKNSRTPTKKPSGR